MMRNSYFHRGYSLRHSKSKPLINHGIISEAAPRKGKQKALMAQQEGTCDSTPCFYCIVVQIVTVLPGAKGEFPLSQGTGSFREAVEVSGECSEEFYRTSASVKSKNGNPSPAGKANGVLSHVPSCRAIYALFLSMSSTILNHLRNIIKTNFSIL
jgi:hypothetical protein